MNEAIAEILRQAQQFLKEQKPDQAIDVLRISDSNQHSELAALLARCYAERGDTRGDVYSSTYFAQRAIALGHVSDEMYAIVGVGQFRKSNYAEAVAAFASFVNDASAAYTKYLYALALYYNKQVKPALTWMDVALRTDPTNESYQQALAAIKTKSLGKPEKPYVSPKKLPGLGGVDAKRPVGVDSPGEWSALSKLAGYAHTAKDLHWLEQSIPCQKACPAGTDIPAYLTEIYKGNFRAAYDINLRDNVFPGVLGRVCARPCESDCRHGREGLGETVAICFSKRGASDLQVNDNPVVMEKLFPETGKRVAVIGAGPAGLAAARHLALYGHELQVFEQHAVAGGMMEQGIPVFRLPREVLEKEIKQIELLGVTINCNAAIGKDIRLADLERDFDAVIIAAGTLRPNYLDIPGKALKGIRHGLEFLLEANHNEESAHPNETVIVIGGGFTAMDCARTVKRLGAKLVHLDCPDSKKTWRGIPLTDSKTQAQVLYRRSENEMLVTPGEVEELHHEGVQMHYLISPVKYLGEKGCVTGMQFIRNELGKPDASGRRRPIPIAGSEFEVAADIVLLATGQFPDTDWIEPSYQADLVDKEHWPLNAGGYETARQKIFLAGDFSTGAKSLIDAIAHAKDAARQVDTFLMGSQRMQAVAIIEDAPRSSERIREMDYVPMQYMPTIPLSKRYFKAEVETGYDPQLAIDEAQRCYQCNYKYEIDPDVCIYCNWCVKAKPQADCIVEISSLNYGKHGEIIGFNRAKTSEEVKQVYINQSECIRCHACVDACPVDAISVQKVSLAHVRIDDLDKPDIATKPRL